MHHVGRLVFREEAPDVALEVFSGAAELALGIVRAALAGIDALGDIGRVKGLIHTSMLRRAR